MSRELNNDFEIFIEFLKSYKLANVFDSKDVSDELKKVHKKYFSFLSLVSELEQYIDNTSFINKIGQIQFSYIAESSSDIGTAIFHSANGSYKSAKMMLRSSIETFFKGFCSDDINGILIEKRIYKIFGHIKELEYFQVEPQKSMFRTCLNEYSDLCKDTHTAEKINMQKLTALKYFPSYDQRKMVEISNKILTLIPIFLFLICDKFNLQFHQMHHRNQENIMLSIQKRLRPTILAREGK